MSLKSLFNFGDETKVEKDIPQIQLTADRAKACLGLKEFKKYRAMYQLLEEKVIEELIIEAANFCVSADNIEKFGAKCLVKLTRLRDLRSLVNKVDGDSKKSGKPVDNDK